MESLSNSVVDKMPVERFAIDAMIAHGGSFVKALAECWLKADHVNKARLEEAFPYFENYRRRFLEHGKN